MIWIYVIIKISGCGCLNANFNNISFMPSGSILLEEKIGGHGENSRK
jgi:hypothetical protein